MSEISYSEFIKLCNKSAKRFGKNILSLPLGERPVNYLKRLYTGGMVLDYGCGAGKPLQKILGISDEYYHTCDNDIGGSFTYTNIEQIPDNMFYDVIFSDQVFEHLEFWEGVNAAKRLAGHVKSGGIFIITVPNVQHPTRQLSNPFHKTPLGYLHICGFLELGGLTPVYCARYNKSNRPRMWERPLVNMLCRIFRIDWCDSVFAVGKK